jgi:hypothetical protein
MKKNDIQLNDLEESDNLLFAANTPNLKHSTEDVDLSKSNDLEKKLVENEEQHTMSTNVEKLVMMKKVNAGYISK